MKATPKKVKAGYYKNRFARTKIARALLEGPDWLKPQKRVDDFGWLDPVLVIAIIPLGADKPASSYSVFVDDTVNRDGDFLRPVVRKAYWHRPEEYKKERFSNWPLVDVRQHIMSASEQKRMHSLLRTLDIAFRKIDFLTGGLITDRTVPQGTYPKGELPSPRDLYIKRETFCQRIEFRLDTYAGMNRHLERAAHSLIKYIDILCKNPETSPYRECYSKNLHDEMSGSSRWFYRPKRPRYRQRYPPNNSILSNICIFRH